MGSFFQHEFTVYNFKHNNLFYISYFFQVMLILKKNSISVSKWSILYFCYYFHCKGIINMKIWITGKSMSLFKFEMMDDFVTGWRQKKAYFCGRWDKMSTCGRPHVEKLQILLFDTEQIGTQ